VINEHAESGGGGGVVLSAALHGHSAIDFDKRKVKKALQVAARKVQKAARKMVSRRAISQAGQAPGRDTGALQKSISLRWGSGGFWVRVEPTTAGIKATGKVYYPAILYFGAPSHGLAARANYMADALDGERAGARAAIRQAMQEALKPR
jgi:hypothetical protein